MISGGWFKYIIIFASFAVIVCFVIFGGKILQKLYVIKNAIENCSAIKLGLILFLVVILTKVFFVFLFNNDADKTVDMHLYKSFATQLANNGIITENIEPALLYKYEVIYGLFLSPVIKIFGNDSKVLTSFLSLLFAVSSVFLFDIIKKYVGKNKAFLGLLIFNILPVGLFETQLLIHETPLLFFYVTSFWLLTKCFDNSFNIVLRVFAYPVDILINYNIFSSQADYDELYKRAEEKPRFVLGTDYVPLRKEFSDCAYRKPERVKNILVSTGGADTRHIAVKLLEYLNDNPEKLSDYCLKFIVGSMNRDIEIIKKLSDKLPNVELMIDVKNMKELMRGCDLAVSAAGSTLYELCVCSVPTITYVIADNQLPAARAFEQNGLMVNVGDLRERENVGELIYNSIKELIEDSEKRESMVKSAYELINRDGSKKTAELLRL